MIAVRKNNKAGGDKRMAWRGRKRPIVRVVAGFLLIWLVLDRSAAMLGSTLGQWGLLVCGLTVAAAVGVEAVGFGRSPPEAVRALGLSRPGARALMATAALAGALLAFYPALAAATGARVGLREDWLWLLPGLFAQGGVAEETLFRGYLFRHFRVGRTFWKAAVLSLMPFVGVHLLLFAQLSWPLALASILLAAAMSIPMARLFELGGGLVWAPALLHFVVQGSIKLVVFPEALAMPAAVGWIGLSAVLPWAVFLVGLPARRDCGGSVSH